MCVLCGDPPTWRYHFADGRRFTSSMSRYFAEAQARAVETTEEVAIIKIEQFVSGEWRTTPPEAGKESTQP